MADVCVCVNVSSKENMCISAVCSDLPLMLPPVDSANGMDAFFH